MSAQSETPSPAVTPTDSRRQTGAGRLLDGPGAALEVKLDAAERDAAAQAWTRHARVLAGAVGWTDATLVAKPCPSGLSLALSAPIDALYAATELNEAAWGQADAERRGMPVRDTGAIVADLRRQIEAERDPALITLTRAAVERGLPIVGDDDAQTIGYGAAGQTWPANTLPEPSDVHWDDLGSIPIALITGTNGKSTTSRMVAAIAREAGYTVGSSSTDAIIVGDEVMDRGDYSGPLGARMLIRDTRVTAAILEVARGGLLRRGVPVPWAMAAAVTNVASDHLGEYGVETIEALAEGKFVVAKALHRGGVLVCPAEEAAASREAERLAPPLAARGVVLAWTALDPSHPRLTNAARAAAVVDHHIALRHGNEGWRPVCRVSDIPASWDGALAHVVRNALTAAAVADALSFPPDAIARGLGGFKGDTSDNPGRTNRYDIGGAHVIVDYAHNAHALRAICDAVRHLPAKRRLVLASTAGDRSDEELAAMGEALATVDAERYLTTDSPSHLRGRQPGEIGAHIRASLISNGIAADRCSAAFDTLGATQEALNWAEPGDLVLLSVLAQREEVAALLNERGTAF